MRLRDLNPEELDALALRRAEVRETLAKIQAGWKPNEAALANAPFLDDWQLKTYPGTDLSSLEGDCWGHPTLGNRWGVRTSVVLHMGEGFAVTENTVYILGRPWEGPSANRRVSILNGRRGAGRVEPAAETDADVAPEVKP